MDSFTSKNYFRHAQSHLTTPTKINCIYEMFLMLRRFSSHVILKYFGHAQANYSYPYEYPFVYSSVG